MLYNIKKVKQTDKRKMHTLLKLIGRTGIWKILQGNRNAANWSKLIGTQPQGNLLFSRRQAQSICFSPQKQKIIGKTLIFLKQAVFQDYFKVQLEIFSYFCKVHFKIFLYGQANYQKYHHRDRLADSQYRVMITGSNAKMLGKEIWWPTFLAR